MSERIIDPGNEPSAAKPNTLPWLRQLVQKHKGFSLSVSEAYLFELEIQRLEIENFSLKRDLNQALTTL